MINIPIWFVMLFVIVFIIVVNNNRRHKSVFGELSVKCLRLTGALEDIYNSLYKYNPELFEDCDSNSKNWYPTKPTPGEILQRLKSQEKT